jgi:hypothetical protein
MDKYLNPPIQSFEYMVEDTAFYIK